MKVLTDTKDPGWAHIVAVGGTFSWESWTLSDVEGDGMSHGWGSSALVAFQTAILGVTSEPMGATPAGPVVDVERALGRARDGRGHGADDRGTGDRQVAAQRQPPLAGSDGAAQRDRAPDVPRRDAGNADARRRHVPFHTLNFGVSARAYETESTSTTNHSGSFGAISAPLPLGP